MYCTSQRCVNIVNTQMCDNNVHVLCTPYVCPGSPWCLFTGKGVAFLGFYVDKKVRTVRDRSVCALRLAC